MEPLRIIFRLNRPMVAPEHLIHLDALLAWARVEEARDQGVEDPIATQHDLPLARHEAADGRWVFCASALAIHALAPPMPRYRALPQEAHVLAQLRGDVYEGGPNVLTPGTGPHKAFLVTHMEQPVDSVTGWAIGDRQRITELLARVRSVGKLRKLSAGNIVERSIEPAPRAQTLWKLRRMPEPEPGYAAIRGPITPPYWDRTRQDLAYEPLDMRGAHAA